MSRSARETLFTLGYLVVGVAAAIVAGYLTYRHRFSHYPLPMLPILVAGISGALIYASVHMRGLGVTLLMLVLLFLAHVAMAPPIRVSSLVGAAVFSVPVGVSMIASSYVMKSLQRIKFGKFLLSGVLLALGNSITMLITLLRRNDVFTALPLVHFGLFGALLGVGVGLGMEVIDLLGPPSESDLVQVD